MTRPPVLTTDWYLRLLSPDRSEVKPIKEYTLDQLFLHVDQQGDVESNVSRRYGDGGLVLGRQSSASKEDRNTRVSSRDPYRLIAVPLRVRSTPLSCKTPSLRSRSQPIPFHISSRRQD